MATTSALRVAVLFPELLGTYGDGGNALVLRQRLAWRNVPAEVVSIRLQDPVPAGCDLYVVGGGEDDAQRLALISLQRDGTLARAVADGAHVFAVCAGLQILGTSVTEPDGRTQDGLGLIDVSTRRRAHRAVGEVVATPAAELGLPLLTGFENHGGGTRLGPAARPLATVRHGVGNGGGPGDEGGRDEGVLQGTVVATYLHGPVLARNPMLADLVLSRALGQQLAPLEHPQVDRLRRERLAEAAGGRRKG